MPPADSRCPRNGSSIEDQGCPNPSPQILRPLPRPTHLMPTGPLVGWPEAPSHEAAAKRKEKPHSWQEAAPSFPVLIVFISGTDVVVGLFFPSVFQRALVQEITM